MRVWLLLALVSGALSGAVLVANADAAKPPPPSTMRIPACSNGIDDDGDGLVDFPADPGCESDMDNDESGGGSPPPGGDSDGDGIPDADDNCPYYYSPDNWCDEDVVSAEPEDEAGPTYYSGDGGGCTWYRVARLHRNLFGAVRFKYHMKVDWCWNASVITEVSVRTWDEPLSICCWTFVGHTGYDVRFAYPDATYYPFWNDAEFQVWGQGKFRLCFPKGWGCVREKSPWVEITVYKGGGHSKDTGGT